MKYKLINKDTDEFTLCDKIVHSKFDYYTHKGLTGEYGIDLFSGFIFKNCGSDVGYLKGLHKSYIDKNIRSIVATNNQNDACLIPCIDVKRDTNKSNIHNAIEFSEWIVNGIIVGNLSHLWTGGYKNRDGKFLTSNDLYKMWSKQKNSILYYQSIKK